MKTFAVRITMAGNAVPSDIFPSLNGGYDNVHKGLFLIDAESKEALELDKITDERIMYLEVLGEVENIQDYRNEFPPGTPVTSEQLSYLDNIEVVVENQLKNLTKDRQQEFYNLIDVMTKNEKIKLLAHASGRANNDKGLLAYRLYQYQYDADLSDIAFAEFLKVHAADSGHGEMERFYLLHLVAVPKETVGDEYNAWLKKIHEYLGCDWEKLHEVIQYTFGKYT